MAAPTVVMRAYDTVALQDIFWTTDTPYAAHSGYPGPNDDYPNAWASLWDVCVAQTLPTAGVADVSFTSVKDALAAADTAVDFASQQLAHVGAPDQPHHGARLADVTAAVSTANGHADAAAAAAVVSANAHADAAAAAAVVSANQYTDEHAGGPPDVIDAHTLLRWKLDEDASPYVNSGVGGALDITGTGATPGAAMAGGAGVMFGNGGVSLATEATLAGKAQTLSAHGRVKLFILDGSAGDGYFLLTTPISIHFLNAGAGAWEVTVTYEDDTYGWFNSTSSRGQLRLGVEHHIGYTLDGVTRELNLYLDGNVVATHTLAKDLKMGVLYPWVPGQNFAAGACIQRDWRVEDVVRTPAQMAAIWRAGR